MKKIFPLLTLVLGLHSVQAQEFVDEDALFMKIVRQVNAKDFAIQSLEGFTKTAYINRENKTSSIQTKPAETKVLTRAELYKKNKPHVYRFIRLFKNEGSDRLMVENVATAFPISEDGHFVMNYHMVELVNVGSGDPKTAVEDKQYILADYDGNILAMDSIVSYNELADVAIVKANTKGKKIYAFPLGKDLETGDNVHVIAHPKAYLYNYSTGVVTRMTQHNNDIYSRKMEISADYAAGSSGGPIFDDAGNIVGIVSLTQSFYYNQKEQRSLQMVIKQSVPVSVIKAFIK